MFLFAGVIIIVSFGFSILGTILRLLGITTGRRPDSQNQARREEDTPATKKIFPDEEGEYVDFEEV